MKKVFAFILCLFTLQFAAQASDERPITAEQLPATAQQFLKKHFPNDKVAFAKAETGWFGDDYEVILVNGCEVEFDSKGEWKDIDCKRTAIPAGIVPQQISDYVKAHRPDLYIVKIERGKRGMEVELNNDIELKFDTKYNLVDYDN